jgi:hypothetical protein
VRKTLDALWKEPERAGEIIRELRAENEDLYRLEKMLKRGDELPAEVVER